MKITRATTFVVGNPWKNWLFVRLDTDQPGLYGVGEGTLNAFARTIETAIHELAPRYEGMDPFQVETIYQRMTRDLYSDGGQIHGNAVAAIEEACWDIIGKETGRPVYDLLGGRYHEDLSAYANGWYVGPRTPESFAERAAEVVARGYKSLKFDPFGSAWRTMTPCDRQLSLDIVRAVRETVGPEVQIMVEGHRRFSVSEAIWVGDHIAEFEPTWFEEPTDHTKIDATAEVARRINVPVSAGESFHTTHQFAELLKYNSVHILQPDPSTMGGILRTRMVCAMADASYAVVAPHQAQGPIATAVCVQIGACTPNLLVQELFDEFNVDWEREIVTPPVHVVDGRIQISDAPGLGIDVNWAEAEKHPYQVTNFLPLFSPGWERREGAQPDIDASDETGIEEPSGLVQADSQEGAAKTFEPDEVEAPSDLVRPMAGGRLSHQTKRSAFYVPIARAIQELGGSAHLDEVLSRVESSMSGQFTKWDYTSLDDGEIRWRNSARWARKDMVIEGLLKSGSPRSIWELSNAGKEWLSEHGI